MGKHDSTPEVLGSRSCVSPKGACRSEANKIASRPEFEASERLKNLLFYLADCSDQHPSRRITQIDIAQNVMRLGNRFDPSSDAHVRIEVSRLRAALAGYYSRSTAPTSRRLSIPKGGYKVQLTLVPNSHRYSSKSIASCDPVVALGTLCAEDYLSRSVGFEVECEILKDLATSELSTDGLISFSNVEGKSLDNLARHAELIGASVLLVVRVVATERIRVYVSALCPRNRVVLHSVKFGDWPATEHNLPKIQELSRNIVKEILDPISGMLLKQICKLNPASRLSQLSKVFEFMDSQNRSLLPEAYAAAQYHSENSNVAAALSIDMHRASYCFSTDQNIRDLSSISDRSEALAEQSKDCAWTQLAMGYAGISRGRKDLVRRAISAGETMPLLGEKQAGLRLLRKLSGNSATPAAPDKPLRSSKDHTVFDAITNGLDALSDKTDEAANSSLAHSRYSNVFWIQAIQIAASVENGQRQIAHRVFAKMKKSNPCIHSYMDRAISTMIPATDLREKILTGLNSVAR